MKQRISEWEMNLMDKVQLEYHTKQWDNPKRATIHFSNYISNKIKNSNIVIDVGCGLGGSTYYISKQYPKCNFIGIDYIKELVDKGNVIIKNKKQHNIKLKQDDWFNLRSYKNIDGVISLQTLSWLPEYKKPLEELFVKIKPNWICLTSLFHEGDISVKTEITEHSRNKSAFYNTYSIPSIQRFVKEFGYHVEEYKPFEIDIDIPKPTQLNRMSTYTILTNEKKRLQVSGPLLMSWYNLMIVKD